MLALTMNLKSPPKYQSKYTCKYCSHSFVHESRFLSHKCKHMKRLEEFQTPDGQAAWLYYQQWLRAQKRMPPPSKSFLTSKYYRTFINFAKHVKAVGLPKPDKFIWLMQEKTLQPSIWTSNDVYSIYLEHLDRNTSPVDQAKLSIDTLLNIADKAEMDVSNVFEKLAPNDVIHLLRTRQISPWLLLRSKKFKILFRDQASPEQQVILETLIRPDYWMVKFEKHPKELAEINKYVAALDL